MSMTKHIQLLYFASVRELLGRDHEPFESAAGSVADLRRELAARGGSYQEAFEAGRVLRCAVNQDMADEHAALNDGDEVAFFPPVTGG